MENFYFKTFFVNGEKFTFCPSHRTPLKVHKNDVDLCNTNLTIPFSEMETAIKELQKNGKYKDFVVSEYIAERNKKDSEQHRKNTECWENIHKKVEHKKTIMREVIAEIKTYCNKQESWHLVYNKLEDNIKNGYFVVYTYRGHKTIRLQTIGIVGYKERIVQDGEYSNF